MSIIRDKRRLLKQTTTLAIAQTVQVTEFLRDRPIPELAFQLRRTMPAVSDSFADVAGVVSADSYNKSRALANLSTQYKATSVKANTSQAMNAAIGFGIAQLTRGTDYDVFQSTLSGSVQKLVLGGDRETVEFNIVTDPDGTRYERVASPNACGFCLTMAAVAEVQRENYFEGYHNFCQCTLNPVFQGQSGFRPDYYNDVEKAYFEADAILEEQRQAAGWYSMKTKQAAAEFPELVLNTPNHLRIMRELEGYK
jgi:hypothetical protein